MSGTPCAELISKVNTVTALRDAGPANCLRTPPRVGGGPVGAPVSPCDDLRVSPLELIQYAK